VLCAVVDVGCFHSFLSECQALSVIRPGSPRWYQTGVLSASISFSEIGISHMVPNQGSTVGGGRQTFAFRQKLLGEDGSVRRGIVMGKQPGLFSPKFGATSSHVLTQSPQNIAVHVEPGISSLACWDNFLCYHTCCKDGGISPEYFGYHLATFVSAQHGTALCLVLHITSVLILPNLHQ
jgi:hypothetical protein